MCAHIVQMNDKSLYLRLNLFTHVQLCYFSTQVAKNEHHRKCLKYD